MVLEDQDTFLVMSVHRSVGLSRSSSISNAYGINLVISNGQRVTGAAGG